ncbi:MAG: hypothetical protein ABI193_20405 [Minicystis sp.]
MKGESALPPSPPPPLELVVEVVEVVALVVPPPLPLVVLLALDPEPPQPAAAMSPATAPIAPSQHTDRLIASFSRKGVEPTSMSRRRIEQARRPRAHACFKAADCPAQGASLTTQSSSPPAPICTPDPKSVGPHTPVV